MKHTYKIDGMTCNGCRNHVERTLSKVEGVTNVAVDLEKAKVSIDMNSHISIETFQKAMENDDGTYRIHKLGEHVKTKEIKKEKHKGKGTGTFYCPMHCEGSGSDEPGECPVCGMDYVKNEDVE